MSSGTSLAQNTGAGLTGQFDITNNVNSGNIKLTCKDAGGTNTRSATVSYAGIDMGAGNITTANSISATTFNGNLNGTITTTTLPSTGTYYLPYLASFSGSNASVYADGNIYFDRTNNTLNVPNLRSYGALTMNNNNIFGRTDGFGYTAAASNGLYPIGTVLEYKEPATSFTTGVDFQYSTVLPQLTIGVWIVSGNLMLNKVSGTFLSNSYIRIEITNGITGIQQYPTTSQGGAYIPIFGNYSGSTVQAIVSGTIVCTVNNTRPGMNGTIVMTTGSSTKLLQVCFTKIA